MRKRYKIGIVGLGSIGKRHLMNMSRVLESRGMTYSIDLIRRKDSKPLDEALDKMISNVYVEPDKIPNDYDVMWITGPTHLHYEAIQSFSGKTKNMFIEKPVFDRTEVDIAGLSLRAEGIYYVACPLRYTAVIQYVKNNVDLAAVYSARVISSSYLPDWRPGTDYRETYSAHEAQGGGVSIDLIHEWDYLMYLFGKPEQVLNYRGQFSRLEIDSDDLSVYIAKYKTLLAEVHLDYFGRTPIRELQLFTADETIVADLLNSEIRFLNRNEVLRFSEDRNAFQLKEIENFFDMLEGKKRNENDLETALATLKIAKEGKC